MWSSRLLGLEPVPVPPHVFGIDRGHLYCGAFPRANGTGPRFGELRSVELEEDAFAEGPLGGLLREPANFRQSIETLVAKLSATVSGASLVLPDEWLRLSFADVPDLPRKSAEREEVLRWKLKMQVPFRVEDLRLIATEVPPLDPENGDHRVLMSFGIDQLLEQIEQAFEHVGIRLGHISNRSLSLFTALESALGGVEMAAVALVSEGSYSLLVASRGAPLVHRFKSYQPELPLDAKRRFVLRDLRLTRTFLAEKVGNDKVQRIVLISPVENESTWSEWLGEIFETAPTVLADEWPFLRATVPSVRPDVIAPLFGAACRVVA